MMRNRFGFDIKRGIESDAALLRANPDKCPTCGKNAGTPYRVYDARGKVIHGCIDAYHTGHLITPSESAFWHNRAEAKKMRAAAAKHLRELGKRSRRTNPARISSRGIYRVEMSKNGREWKSIPGMSRLTKTTAVQGAKTLHKHAPHLYVRVLP